MNIKDWIQGKVLNLETMEIEERDDLVIIPSWQFALLISKFNNYRQSMIVYFALAVGLVVFWAWSLYLP